MRSFSRLIVCAVFGVAVGASCSRDPETLKRQYIAQGDRYVAEGQLPEAIVAYRNAVGQDERFGEARSKLAAAYQAAGDLSNAVREAVRAADLMPKDLQVQSRAARLLLATGQGEDAKTRALSILALDSKNVDGLILLGNAMARLKDLDGAITQVEEAITQDPLRTLSYSNLALLQIAKGNREAAEAAFKQAVVVQPNSTQAHLALGNYYWAAGQYGDAEKELRVALNLEPTSRSVHRGFAAFFLNTDRRAEAEPHLKALAEGPDALDDKLTLADYYAGTSRPADAVAVLTPLAARDDLSVPAGVRLAALDFRAGRTTDAHRRVEALEEKYPDNELVMLTKARLLLLEKKPGEALTVADAALKRNNGSVGAHQLRGAALRASGSITEATKSFEAALKLTPSFIPAKVALAEMQIAEGDPRRALVLATEVVQAQPRVADARFLYGKALLKNGDLPNAEREFTTVLRALPESSDVHAWIGALREAKRDVAGARQAYQRALALDTANQMAFAGVLSTDVATNQLDDARERVERRLAAYPNDPAVLRLAGLVFTRLSSFDRAEASYRKLLEVDPNNLDAYGGLAGLYLGQRRVAEARSIFETVAKDPGAAVAANTMIGMLLTVENKHEEARKYYQEALALNQRAAVAANNLAWDYAEHGGNLSVALQLAQSAKAQLPHHPQVNDTLGWVYYKNNLFAQAVDALKEAAEKSPANAQINYRLGLAYMKSGKLQEARTTLQRVLKLDPKFAESENVPQTLATLQG